MRNLRPSSTTARILAIASLAAAFAAPSFSDDRASTTPRARSAVRETTRSPRLAAPKTRTMLRARGQTAAAAAAAVARPEAVAKGKAVAEPPKFLILTDTIPGDFNESEILSFGVERYTGLYQNNFDTDAQLTGLINPDKLVAEVYKRMGPNPAGWCMLDYEFPFDANFKKGPGNPDYEKSVKSMVEALKRVKAEFPNVKFTYYGIPGLSRFIDTPTGQKSLVNTSQELQQQEIEKQLTAHAPVLREMDWVQVCIYDIYEKSVIAPDQAEAVAKREHDYNVLRVKMCKDFYEREGLAARPVIPAVNLYYAPGGNTVANRVIPIGEFEKEQLAAAMAAGADGVAFWTGVDYYIKQATKVDFAENHPLRTEQKRVREAMTANYLGGQLPPEWASEALRRNLLEQASLTLRQAVERVRVVSDAARQVAVECGDKK